MKIRKATYEDLPRLMEIYREAREIMLSCGDVNQWKPGHPPEEMIRADIERGHCHAVIDDESGIVGAFAYIPGIDPTYNYIEGGEWLDDTLPYVTLHRIGSCIDSKGVAECIFDWCRERTSNIRIDTHEDNVIMRHCIEKAGFSYCGIIYLLSGAPRLAYQRVGKQQ